MVDGRMATAVCVPRMADGSMAGACGSADGRWQRAGHAQMETILGSFCHKPPLFPTLWALQADQRVGTRAPGQKEVFESASKNGHQPL
jgi:hypothetical protein